MYMVYLLVKFKSSPYHWFNTEALLWSCGDKFNKARLVDIVSIGTYMWACIEIFQDDAKCVGSKSLVCHNLFIEALQ